MSEPSSVTMEAGRIDDFLAERWYGVLGLARAGESYAVPVSYAYERTDRELYFRLAYAPDSYKREFVDATRVATFVVTDHTDEGVASVIARGPLEEVTESTVSTALMESIRTLEIPFASIFERQPGELEYRIARLTPETMSGRAESP